MKTKFQDRWGNIERRKAKEKDPETKKHRMTEHSQDIPLQKASPDTLNGTKPKRTINKRDENRNQNVRDTTFIFHFSSNAATTQPSPKHACNSVPHPSPLLTPATHTSSTHELAFPKLIAAMFSPRHNSISLTRPPFLLATRHAFSTPLQAIQVASKYKILCLRVLAFTSLISECSK